MDAQQAPPGGSQPPLAPEGPTPPPSQDAALPGAPDAAAAAAGDGGRDEAPVQQQQQQQQQQQAPAPLRSCGQLQALEAALGSPLPWAAPRFITNDDTDAPASKRPRVAPLDLPQHQEEPQQATQEAEWGSMFAPGSHSTDLESVFAPQAARPAAAMERSTSLCVLSPQGSALANSLATPRFARLSAILPAELEPQAPPSSDAAAVPLAAGDGSSDVGPHPARAPKRGFDSLHDDSCREFCEAAQVAAMRQLPGQGGAPSMAALLQWEQTIEAAERQWGSSHPAVGRAWLELARALQAADKDSDRAKHATKKAFDVCHILLNQTTEASQAQESIFYYLMAKFNEKATKQTREAAVAAAKALPAAAPARPGVVPAAHRQRVARFLAALSGEGEAQAAAASTAPVVGAVPSATAMASMPLPAAPELLQQPPFMPGPLALFAQQHAAASAGFASGAPGSMLMPAAAQQLLGATDAQHAALAGLQQALALQAAARTPAKPPAGLQLPTDTQSCHQADTPGRGARAADA